MTLASKKKFRMTRQRRAILEELKKGTSHPTADQVYEEVRKRLPRISLGTVYRNLEFLSECLVIGKLEVGGTQRRFDTRAENHYHVRCTCCNRVEDLPTKPFIGIEDAVTGMDGYEITGHRLELVGLCSQCKGDGQDS